MTFIVMGNLTPTAPSADPIVSMATAVVSGLVTRRVSRVPSGVSVRIDQSKVNKVVNAKAVGIYGL